MLVLSRKKNEKILFPALGIEVEIVRIAGNAVGVGINAPKSVQILRGELWHSGQAPGMSEQTALTKQKDLSHELRNQLNKVQLAVALAQKQMARGRTQEAEETLQRLLELVKQTDDAGTFRSPGTDASEQVASEKGSWCGAAHEAAVGRGCRALVVEDDSNERALLAGYLRLCGYQVSEAEDGRAAMSFLERQPVDLVVLDMQMPRMNGSETVAAIRQHPRLKDVRIVVVSGEDRDERTIAAAGPQMTEWLAKPLNPEVLVGHLREAVC